MLYNKPNYWHLLGTEFPCIFVPVNDAVNMLVNRKDISRFFLFTGAHP